MEENNKIVEAEETKDNVEEVHEESVVKEKPHKKVPWLTILLAVVVVVLGVLLITGKSFGSSTYNLSDIYPTYFAEKEGSIKFPNNWLADSEGNLFYNNNGILSAKGVIMGADISEDEFNELIESSASYVELEQIENYKYTAYKGLYSVESSSSVYTFAYIYNDGQLIQVLLVDVSDDEFNSIVDSLNF